MDVRLIPQRLLRIGIRGNPTHQAHHCLQKDFAMKPTKKTSTNTGDKTNRGIAHQLLIAMSLAGHATS